MHLTDENKAKLEQLKRNNEQITQPAERKPFRADGYVNLLNKYGTGQDNSDALPIFGVGSLSL